jgi:CPA2 family monovalent cation:H+ antiporter-2
MGEVGRCVADGLDFHGIPYTAIEMDHERFIRANADGYPVVFGDLADVRLLETLEVGRRMTVVVTIIRYEVSQELTPVLRDRYPHLTRYVAVNTEEQKARFATLGMKAVVNRSTPKGLELAAALLQDQGVDPHKIQEWLQRQQEQALGAAPLPMPSAEAA